LAKLPFHVVVKNTRY